MSMITISLQSGSNGNCIYVEAGSVRLLFDAGISGIKAEKRLAEYGCDIRQVDALIISHDHSDHVLYSGVYQRKYGLPVYITPKTFQSAEEKYAIGTFNDVRFFQAGKTIDFDDVTVQTIPTPHDGRDGTAFVVSFGEKRLGILTDLGHVFDELKHIISSLDAVFIESNYDMNMLEQGPYPGFLKRRIKGPGGHLSNLESAQLLREASLNRLRWACLVHLSEQNNMPSVALQTHRDILNSDLTLYAASRYMSSVVFTV